MKELICKPLEDIKGTPEYTTLLEESSEYRKASMNSFIFASLILAVSTPLFIPIILAWLYWNITSIISLVSPSKASMTIFDPTSTVISMIISITIEAAGTIVFLVYFNLGTWWLDSFRAAFTKQGNVATKLFIADNAAEVQNATTRGLFGLIYHKLENDINNLIPFVKLDFGPVLSFLYPKGAVVLRTPSACWPIYSTRQMLNAANKIRKPFEVRASEVNGKLVLAEFFQGACAIAVVEEGKDDVLSKLIETVGRPQSL